jgi:hypothetical protein
VQIELGIAFDRQCRGGWLCDKWDLRNHLADGRSEAIENSAGVASERALLASMGVLDDPFACEMLTPSMTMILWVVEHGRSAFGHSR